MNNHNCHEIGNLLACFDSILEYTINNNEPIEPVLFSHYLTLTRLEKENINRIKNCILCYSILKNSLKGLRKHLGIKKGVKKPRQLKLKNKVVFNTINKKESAKQQKEICKDNSVQHKIVEVVNGFCDKIHEFF